MFAIILKTFFIDILLPVSVKVVKTYVESSDTKNDDKILEVSKIGVNYLATNINNSVTEKLASELNDTKMVTIQRSS